MRAAPLVLGFLVAPLWAQKIPDEKALAAARAEIATEMVELIIESRGAEKAAEFFVARARKNEKRPAGRYLLLGYALECATGTKSLPLVQSVVDEFARSFDVDDYAMLDFELRRLADAKAAPPLAFVYAYLDLAARGVETVDAKKSEHRLASAMAAALKHAKKFGDPTLLAFLRYEKGELEARRMMWQRLMANPLDENSKQGRARRGRHLCFTEGNWAEGLPLLDAQNAVERHILASKGQKSFELRDCLSIADSWLSQAKTYKAETVAELRLVRRNLWRHSLTWYHRAWPMSKGAERKRLIRAMNRIEGRMAETPAPGRIRFREDGAKQMLMDGGPFRVEKDLLVAKSVGDTIRGTCRYAFKTIRSVTIRGGIRSKKNQNFRFAVGPFNALCNWEVKPENHFFLHGRRSHTAPALLQSGKEHVFRVRQIGDEVILFVDDVVAFRGKGKLSGTVCVYPAMGSEIFVREIIIDGDVDPLVEVEGPIGKTW